MTGDDVADANSDNDVGGTPNKTDQNDEKQSISFNFAQFLFLLLFVAVVVAVIIWLRWVFIRKRETQILRAQVRLEAQNIEQSSAVSNQSANINMPA